MALGTISPSTSAAALHFNMIPDEIWLQIFLVSMNKDNNRLSDNPFLLSTVCADWRRIALANTILWDTVSISLSTNGSDDGQSSRAATFGQWFQTEVVILKVWIGRAGTRPLSIKVEAPFLTSTEGKVSQQVPRIIVEHAPQIVSLDIPLRDQWCPLFQGVEFPQLRALRLKSYPRSSTGGLPDFSRSSHLSVVKVPGSIGRVVLPWPQIVDVQLSCIDTGDCFRALDLLPNLEHFSCYSGLDSDRTIGKREIQRRESPSLTALSFKDADVVFIQKILDSLPLTLHELYLGIPKHRSPPRDHRLIFESIPPFATTLRSLTVCFTPPDSAAFSDLLQLLLGLEKLDICILEFMRGFDDRFFLRCFARVGVLPRLSHLTFGGFGDELANETIMTILQYRRHLAEEKDCVKINKVRFRFVISWRDPRQVWERVLDPAMKAKLKDMIEDGLDVAITSSFNQLGPGESLIWDD